jgi:NAD(P)-dependent dehydrogenase (short-subunit alcohol dehydrogenase family)
VFEKSSFVGKISLITGATGHLGKEISRAFATLGSNLILVDIHPEALQSLADELSESFGVDVSVYSCDFSDTNARKSVVSAIFSDFQVIDVLVNNAAFVGTSQLPGWSAPFEAQQSSIWPRVFEVNLTAMFDFAQGLSRNLMKSKTPAIVNIASSHGHVGPDWGLYEGTSIASPAAYSTSKAGVIHLTKWLSATMGPRVRVNSVSPGGMLRGQEDLFIQRYKERIPLGRMGTEADISGAVVFLASEMSSFITGQDICVDGGYGVL